MAWTCRAFADAGAPTGRRKKGAKGTVAAYGYYAMALVEARLGHCEQSIAHAKQALALSPRDPLGGAWHSNLGVAEICRGRLDAAIGEFKQAIDARHRTYFPYAYLVAAEAARGNDAEAKLALAEPRRVNPQLTIKWFAENEPVLPPTIVDGWRKAGLPEE